MVKGNEARKRARWEAQQMQEQEVWRRRLWEQEVWRMRFDKQEVGGW